MIDLQSRLPAGFTHRELWYMQDTVSYDGGTTYYVPTACKGGHQLTLMNSALKRTTCDGVHGTGAATSNIVIAAHADQQDKAAFHITLRFKLDTTFAETVNDKYLFKWTAGGTDYIEIYLKADAAAANRKLYFVQGNPGGGVEFTLTSTNYTWTAGTWYTITGSFDDVPVQRLLVDGSLEDSDTVATPIDTPAGGDMVFMDSSDGGTEGISGVASWVVIGMGATAAVALTTTADTGEEALLNKGIPPATAKVQYLMTLDEGHLGQTTAINRGSATGNGTLDSACTWAWGDVRQNCLSFDGINDYAVSAAGADVSGAATLVWVGKMMSDYDTLAIETFIYEVRADGDNRFMFYYDSVTDTLRYYTKLGGTLSLAATDVKPAIGDYWIMIGTTDTSGNIAFWVNGVLLASNTGAGTGIAALAVASIGASIVPAFYDISSPIVVGLIDGAFNARQALEYTITLNNWLELGLDI